MRVRRVLHLTPGVVSPNYTRLIHSVYTPRLRGMINVVVSGTRTKFRDKVQDRPATNVATRSYQNNHLKSTLTSVTNDDWIFALNSTDTGGPENVHL